MLVCAACFVAWTSLTCLWSIDPAASLARTATFVQLLVLCVIVFIQCDTPRRTRILLMSYVAGACVASLATIVRYSQGLQTYWRRYAAPGFDPNDLGITVALAVPTALYLGGTWRAAVLLIGAAVLLTASRTAMIATALGFVFVLWTWRKATARERATGLVLAAALAVGAIYLAPEPARQRLATTTTEISRGTLHNRTTIWKAGVRAFRERPLLGAGTGAYPDAVKPYIGVPGRPGHEYVAHNVFLSVLVETGLLGFALYCSFLLSVALFVWALHHRERALWAITLLVWLTAAATLTWEHRKPSWLIPALIAAMWTRSFRGGEESS
jgi:O-antigen ligase